MKGSSVIAVLIFITLLMAILKPVKQIFRFDVVKTVVISVCVSLLATIGLYRIFDGSMEFVLLPYAALGITILLMMLVLWFKKKNKFLRQTHKTSKLCKNVSNPRLWKSGK